MTMNNIVNELLTAKNPVTGVSLPNPAMMMAIGQRGVSSGFDKLVGMGDAIKQRRIDSDVGTAVSSVDGTGMAPEQYQKALFGAIGQVDGMTATKALGLASGLAKPAYDARAYRDDRVDASNLNNYRNVMSGRGSYGMTVDDYGNSYMLNKHTGEVVSGDNNVDTAGRTNPKNVVLKSITSRDANGVETTRQVPFDKTTGQPIQNGTNTVDDSVDEGMMDNAIAFIKSKGLTLESYAQLSEAEQKKLDVEYAAAIPTATTPVAGTKMPKKLDNSINNEMSNALNLKQLRQEIKQEISCRLKLLNYKPNEILGLGILDGSFSVYKLEGSSSVNTPYSFTLVFVSDDFINVEDIVDTDVQITLQDEVNPIIKKTIFGVVTLFQT